MSQTRSNVLLGILIMVGAMFCYATKDGFAKFMSQDISPFLLVWIQFAFMFIIVSVWTAARHGWEMVMPRPYGFQLLRGLITFLAVGLFYWGLKFIPIADASAMVLSAPLVVTALAPIFLGEKLRLKRTVAVLIGFAGVLFILRPDLTGERTGYFLTLGAGIGFGLFYISNRMIAGRYPPIVSAGHSVAVGAVLFAPVAFFVWQTPAADVFWPLMAFLVFSALGQTLLVSAFSFGQANVIAPFQYTVLVFSTLIGLFVFGTFPDAWTWVGIALVIGAGLYIARREAQMHRECQSRESENAAAKAPSKARG